jgi:hypothetical protein
MSDLPAIQNYLALTPDETLPAQIDALKVDLTAKQIDLEAAQAAHAAEAAPYLTKLAELTAEYQDYYAEYRRQGYTQSPASRACARVSNEKYAVETTIRELPTFMALRELNQIMATKQLAVERLEAEIISHKRKLSEATANLPEGLASLDRSTLTLLVEHLTSSITGLEGDEEEVRFRQLPKPQQAAILRGEAHWDCTCAAGYVRRLWESNQVTINILHNDRIRHEHCRARSVFNVDWVPGALPEKFTGHRLASLAPYDRSPLTTRAQLGPIGKLPPSADDVRGWLWWALRVPLRQLTPPRP